MGIFSDNRKFNTTVEQSNPTNPTGYLKMETNDFDFNKPTIKKQQNKTLG